MRALLHAIGAVVVLPYVALALLFVFIGEVARARGLFALIDFVWNHVDWFFGWGIYAALALWICLVATGFVPRLQRASSLCLCVLALTSFLVVVTLSSTRAEIGGFIFLLPCVAVAAASAWRFFRVGAGM